MPFGLFEKPKKPKEKSAKWSPDVQKLKMDFFCHLTYMAALSTSGISPRGLFHFAAKLPYNTTHYFKRVNVVARAFNHHYSGACRIVGESIEDPDIKAFMLRLSSAISSGEDLPRFLDKEANIASEHYSHYYERSLETLKSWTDAYVSLIMAAAIMTVMSVVTMMLGSTDNTFNIAIGLTVMVITIAGVYLIYRSAPHDGSIHNSEVNSREQTIARSLVKIILPLCLFEIIFLVITGASLGAILLFPGLTLFPLGFMAYLNDSKIRKRDNDIAGFLRSLGSMSQAINVNTNEAIVRLDPNSMGSMKNDVNLLSLRLQTGIESKLCWDRFVDESGSELVSRSVRIFQDSIIMGGEAEKVGKSTSNFATKISLLRSQRKLIEGGFFWLANVMHLIMVILVIFIYEIFNTFAIMVQGIIQGSGSVNITAALSTFSFFAAGSSQLQVLHMLVIAITLVLTAANALAQYCVSGGHIFKLFYYLAITMTMSGMSLLAAPFVVQLLFNNMVS
jgi:flagellar protein FlaJ